MTGNRNRGIKRVNLRLEGLVESSVRSLGSLVFRVRRKAATFSLLLLTLPVGYKAIYGTHGWIAYHQQKLESRKLSAEIQELQSKNEKLGENIKALKTDRNTIEREAREQLHYARPNDVVITVPQPASPPPPSSETAARR